MVGRLSRECTLDQRLLSNSGRPCFGQFNGPCWLSQQMRLCALGVELSERPTADIRRPPKSFMRLPQSRPSSIAQHLNAQTVNELPYHPKSVISLTIFAATSIVQKMPKSHHFHAIIEFDTATRSKRTSLQRLASTP
jgi:hypothetical protein